MRGETRLYDQESLGFFNAPWTLVFLVPSTWVPLRAAQGLLTVVSILMLVAAARLSQTGAKPFPVYAFVFALLNLHTFDLLIRANLDAFVTLGVALGWWAIQKRHPVALSFAFWLMAIKPTNVMLPMLLYLLAIVRWARADQLRALSLPAISLAISLAIIGFDAPQRYFDNYRIFSPPKEYLTLTLWRVSRRADLPYGPAVALAGVFVGAFLWRAWRDGVTEWTLTMALATNLFCAPYAIGNHYVYLVPAVVFLARENGRLALLAYATTWTPLLRLAWGIEIAPIDMAYPALVLAAGWYFSGKYRAAHDASLAGQPSANFQP
jgi:hypothetical protein